MKKIINTIDSVRVSIEVDVDWWVLVSRHVATDCAFPEEKLKSHGNQIR